MEVRQRKTAAKTHDHHGNTEVVQAEQTVRQTAEERLKLNRLASYFAIVMYARVLSAFLNLIHDCDEVYNYWEPLHFLLYGNGFKTWEYSSKYALRSWLYIYCHALPAYPLSLLLSPPQTFYGIRLILGVLSGVADCAVLNAFNKLKWTTNQETRLLAVFLCVSPGLFISSTSFLPSSLAQTLMSVAISLTLNKSGAAACAVASIAAMLPCWPFIGVAAVPIGLVFLISQPLITIVSVALPILAVPAASLPLDYAHFKKLTFPHLNLVFYNSSSSSLYGVEPGTFYWKNLALNFNLILPLSLLGCGILLYHLLSHQRGRAPRKLSAPGSSDLMVVSAVAVIFPLWLGFMLLLPHKEERFLYPIYGSICISASIGLSRAISGVFSSTYFSKWLSRFKNVALGAVVVVIVLLSVLRVDALLLHYSSSFKAWKATYELTKQSSSSICVGKEWYRFTSSFFVHDSSEVVFFPDGFDGLLPGAFTGIDSDAWLNDRNIGMAEAYAVNSTLDCDLIVDLVEPPVAENETILYAKDFLVAEKSSVFARTLARVPGRRTFGSYIVKKVQ